MLCCLTRCSCSDCLPMAICPGAQRVRCPMQGEKKVEKQKAIQEEIGTVLGEYPLSGGMWVPLFFGGSAAPPLAEGRVMAGRGSVPGKEVCSLTAEGFLIFLNHVTCLDLASAIVHVKGGSTIKHHQNEGWLTGSSSTRRVHLLPALVYSRNSDLLRTSEICSPYFYSE